MVKSSFYHLRNISKVCPYLSLPDAEILRHAFVSSRLDYCNSLYGGLPANTINRLQLVQNAAARILTRCKKFAHITPHLAQLHWLTVKFRIIFKTLQLTYKQQWSRQQCGVVVRALDS
ncbi:UNVERIFIED_CONTAM: hypothetical protein FKN15_041320 [Acipenser sinensis]